MRFNRKYGSVSIYYISARANLEDINIIVARLISFSVTKKKERKIVSRQYRHVDDCYLLKIALLCIDDCYLLKITLCIEDCCLLKIALCIEDCCLLIVC